MKKKELNLLYLQVFGTALFSITIIISFYLTFEDIRKLKNEKIDLERDKRISLISRTIATISIIIFLYVSVKNYQIAKQEQKGQEEILLFKNEVYISILTLAAGTIAIYNTMKKAQFATQDIENPQI